jgi:hypothetical protein
MASILNSSEISIPTKSVHSMAITHIEVIFLSSMNVLSSLIGTFGNILVFLVVAKCRYLGWQKTEYFICSLAGSDLLVCLVAQPMYITYLNKLLPKNINVLRTTVTWIATLASVSNLLTISIDRFLALLFLGRYRTMMKSRTAIVLVIITWLFSVAIGISASSFYRTLRFVAQYFVIAVLIAVSVFYVGIFLIVRVQCSEMKKRFPSLSRTLRTFTREKTIAKLIAIVIGVFYICYTPLIVLPFFVASPSSKFIAFRVFPWVNTLALCNSCVNPYIYYWRSWRFRYAIQNMNLGRTKFRMKSKRMNLGC